MTNKELEAIARDIIEAKIGLGEEVHMEWAVHEVISGRGVIMGVGKPFYTLCAHEHVYRVVKKAVDNYDSVSSGESNSQMHLEGFEHLQAAYTVKREDQRVLVPIQLIPDAELLERADEYDKLAKGLKKHAKEIRDYVNERASNIQAM